MRRYLIGGLLVAWVVFCFLIVGVEIQRDTTSVPDPVVIPSLVEVPADLLDGYVFKRWTVWGDGSLWVVYGPPGQFTSEEVTKKYDPATAGMILRQHYATLVPFVIPCSDHGPDFVAKKEN